MANENKSGASSLLKGTLAVLGVGLVGYVTYKVAKSYDEMVDKYNDLVDKYNKNIDFINSCDFYEVKKDAPEDIKKDIKNNTFTEIKESIDSNGAIHKETFDAISGFSVHEVVKEGNKTSESNEEILCNPNDFKLL